MAAHGARYDKRGRSRLSHERFYVMLYAVSAKLIPDRALEFHTRRAGRHGALDRDLLLLHAAPA
jgi:hypothetical protein